MTDDRELKKTFGFVITAAVLSAMAGVLYFASAPPSPAEFSDIGEQFYPEFKDPADANRLRLASWNDELAKTDVFEVKFTPENGWTIPSHNDYPADGEEQLSKTAASVVGIERGGLMPGRKDDFARYGVVDPLDQSATGTEGRGSRLTLWKGDTVLADYIIGKKVDDSEDAGSSNSLYYIRKAGEEGEDRIYRASLDVEISTDFSDWIEPDLLKIGSVSDLRRIVIDRYQVDEQSGRVTEGDKSVVSRASATDSWKLEGLDEATESLVTGTVSKITTTLDDLEIIGVRKKPALLTAQLKRQELTGFNQLDVMQMQSDLQSKGFFIDQNGVLVSNEGDFTAGTNDGVMYTLRFGEVFTGSKASLEAGGTTEEDGEPEKSETEKVEEAEAGEEDGSEPDEADSNTLRGRYVFITTEFDETLLPPIGEPPVKPEPPAKDDAAAEAADDKGAETPEGDAADGDKPVEPDADAEAKPEVPAEDPEYKAALEKYEADLAEYEQKKAEHDKKVEAGKKLVEDLSARFADWYYVIAADTFDDLAVDRSDLVEPKEAPAADDAAAPQLPGLPGNDKVEPVMESLKKGDEVETPALGDAEAKPAENPEKMAPKESGGEKVEGETPKPETPSAEANADRPIPPSVPLPKVIPGEAGSNEKTEAAEEAEKE